jgi:hypothetical protein
MPTILKDMISDTRYTEQGGVPQSCTRAFFVKDLTPGVGIAGQACNAPEIPVPNTRHPVYTNLICISKTFELDKNSTSQGTVFCDYGPTSTAVFSAEENEFTVSGGTGLVQKRTAYDRLGNQISVEHEFPADDPDYPEETIVQGAEVDVLSPQGTLVFEGLIRTAFPHYISAQINGSLNSTYWAGGLAGTWMCTDVRFTLFSPPQNTYASTADFFSPRWRFTFEFLWDPDGHLQYAKYVDERKGRPAPDLVYGVGIVPVLWHPYFNFHTLYSV